MLGVAGQSLGRRRGFVGACDGADPSVPRPRPGPFATRYDKRALHYKVIIIIACLLLWLP
ncbi:hypothetical protein Sliba_46480 [Streptomyces nigrescens]|uniref:Uncharacterized protein n=1 Tax=Streptomyces nigrescens TaxID=1920 RepID=A0A640TQ33_STRNI|nr:hypothetical protein Sliba_46480 [Streptomyces libani subsp. libani]GGW00152.1 hypothetical protein GCM10010500_52580 [Streptomyces libani subsp. libani]